MAGNFYGNTSTEAVFTTPISGFIKNFTIVNKTSGSITVNCYKITNDHQISIMPLNLPLSVGQMYESTETKAILAGTALKVQANGSVDYDFNITGNE